MEVKKVKKAKRRRRGERDKGGERWRKLITLYNPLTPMLYNLSYFQTLLLTNPHTFKLASESQALQLYNSHPIAVCKSFNIFRKK
jgi:hypothetical protein